MWLLEDNFNNLVINKWNSLFFYNNRFAGNSAKIFTSKLRNLRIFLKSWSKNVFGSIKIKKDKILSDILTINKIEEQDLLT